MNEKLIIDFVNVFIEQLRDLNSLLDNGSSYDNKFTKFIQKSVIYEQEFAYYLVSRIKNEQPFNIDISHLDSCLNTSLSLIDTGLSIRNHEAKKQLEKCINYSKVLESLLLDILPDIESEYYIASTLSIELLEDLNELIK